MYVVCGCRADLHEQLSEAARRAAGPLADTSSLRPVVVPEDLLRRTVNNKLVQINLLRTKQKSIVTVSATQSRDGCGYGLPVFISLSFSLSLSLSLSVCISSDV